MLHPLVVPRHGLLCNRTTPLHAVLQTHAVSTGAFQGRLADRFVPGTAVGARVLHRRQGTLSGRRAGGAYVQNTAVRVHRLQVCRVPARGGCGTNILGAGTAVRQGVPQTGYTT